MTEQKAIGDRPAMHEKIRNMLAKGLTPVMIQQRLGVSHATITHARASDEKWRDHLNRQIANKAKIRAKA